MLALLALTISSNIFFHFSVAMEKTENIMTAIDVEEKVTTTIEKMLSALVNVWSAILNFDSNAAISEFPNTESYLLLIANPSVPMLQIWNNTYIFIKIDN